LAMGARPWQGICLLLNRHRQFQCCRGPGLATRDLGLPIRKTCERRAAQHAVTKHHDADERPPMRPLDAIAYNKACDALGCTESRRHVWLWPWFMQRVHSFPNAVSAPSAK